MKVRITNGRKGTWYENRIGSLVEVHDNINETHRKDIPFHLEGVRQIVGPEYQLIIGEDCEPEFPNRMY